MFSTLNFYIHAFWIALKRIFVKSSRPSTSTDIASSDGFRINDRHLIVNGQHFELRPGYRLTKYQDWLGNWKVADEKPRLWLCHAKEGDNYVYKFSFFTHQDAYFTIREYIRGVEFAEAFFPTKITSPSEAGTTLLKK